MAEGLFPDLKWHHVGFSVGDIDRAIAFYGEVFGLEVEFRKHIAAIDTHLAFLRRGIFRFEIFQKAGSRPVPDHRRAPNTDLAEQGTKHPCFSVTDCQRALELLAARADVTIVGVVRRPGDPMLHEADPRLSPGDPRPPAAAFFFRDPCDLIVEVVAAGNFPD
jgi:catechol 2,3-dioxygenase-like lactoylglutathione lyase family enzyme